MLFNVNKLRIRNLNNLKEIESAWKNLEHGEDMTVFQSYEWNVLLYEEWNKSIYQKMFCSLEIYILSYEGQIKIILPLLIQKKSTKIKWFGRKKGIYILGYESYSDYLNAIYNLCDMSMFEQLFSAIHMDYPHMKCVFTDIRENTVLCKYFESKNIVPIDVNISVSVRKSTDINEYTSSLSKHTRQNIRTSLNRMNKDHIKYELKTYGVIQNRQLLDNLLDIHISRMKTKNYSGSDIVHRISSLMRIKVRTYREYNNNIIYSSMQKMNNSCVIIVLLNSHVAGYLYGLRDRSTIRILQNCIDEQYKFYSPMFRGTYDFIISCYTDPTITEVDFTRGDEDYKYKLGGIKTKLYKYVI